MQGKDGTCACRKPVRIVVVIENGVCQAVVSDLGPIEVVIADLDVQGCDPDQLTDMVHPLTGKLRQADLGQLPEVLRDVDVVNAVFAAAHGS